MSSCRMRGFTLVELMVTVAVLAVLVGIGYPNFQSTLKSNRLAAATNELVAGIALARSEAIRTTRFSGVCPTSDGSSCSADWSAGWLTWDDKNSDGSLDAGDVVIRHVQGNNNLTITSGGGAARFVFDRRGRLSSYGGGAAAAPIAGGQSLTLQPKECKPEQELMRSVNINNAGQVRVSRGTCK